MPAFAEGEQRAFWGRNNGGDAIGVIAAFACAKDFALSDGAGPEGGGKK